ncbi:MAG TPA: hypothetical protein VGN01_11200 [Acidobacteriaceae bacterium]
MKRNIQGALALAAMLSFAGALHAQQTTTHTNRYGDTVTDTRTQQNGVYDSERSVTAPNGATHTNDFTADRNSNGRVVTSDTHTGANGHTVSSTTTHGFYGGGRTTVTGPKGASRTYYHGRR